MRTPFVQDLSQTAQRVNTSANNAVAFAAYRQANFLRGKSNAMKITIL
jgi:hypothetical protein